MNSHCPRQSKRRGYRVFDTGHTSGHYRAQADVDLTAHQLRHTFANDLVGADVPVTTIQKLLGHAWLETTQTYVAANDRQVQADFYAVSAQLEDWR